MSLYNDASLLLIPSGYKSGTVYSQKPTDGSGDLTFTRASNATRVNSDGLIEKVRTNYAKYSEQIDNAAFWALTNSGTITANNQVSPDGTQNADTLTAGAISSQVQGAIVGTIGTVYTVSIYIKRISGTGNVFLRAVENANTLISVTNEWQRFTATVTSTTTNIRIGVHLGTSGDAVAIWGGQLEVGDIATDYIPTTTAAVSVGMTADVPRLDYTNSSCPALLLEPQRTNTITYSEDINNAFSSKVGVTITSNNTASPDGYVNADLLKFDTTSGYILRVQTVAAATTYTMSVFVKNNNFTSGQLLFFNMSDGVIGGLTAQIDVVAKTATYSGTGGAYTNVSGKVEDYGNGWFRVSVTGTSVNGGYGWYEIAAPGVTNSCYVWGLSLEVGSYSTSYIPTLGTSVTRVADSCSKTGISDLIGQTEGVFFFEFDYKHRQINTSLFDTSLNNNDNIYLLALSDFKLRMWINVGGVFQVAITTPTIPSEGTHKVAMAYKENDCAFYLDGVQMGVDTSCTIPTVDDLLLKTPNQNTRQVLIFKTRLSNTELAALTTI